jgi:hypothetical protein
LPSHPLVPLQIPELSVNTLEEADHAMVVCLTVGVAGRSQKEESLAEAMRKIRVTSRAFPRGV